LEIEEYELNSGESQRHDTNNGGFRDYIPGEEMISNSPLDVFPKNDPSLVAITLPSLTSSFSKISESKIVDYTTTNTYTLTLPRPFPYFIKAYTIIYGLPG
jgi:hypothetical protein